MKVTSALSQMPNYNGYIVLIFLHIVIAMSRISLGNVVSCRRHGSFNEPVLRWSISSPIIATLKPADKDCFGDWEGIVGSVCGTSCASYVKPPVDGKGLSMSL